MDEQFKKIWGKEDEKELGEKHVPVVIFDNTDNSVQIIVKIGEVEHPSLPEHFIQWIEVLDEEISLSRIYLSHFSKPEVIFYLKEIPKKLVVREFCNLHGTWQYREEGEEDDN